MLRYVVAGTTDQSTIVRVVDATTGVPNQSLNATSAGVAMWYRRELGLVTAITTTTRATTTTAHTDGGFVHIDDGYYRLDLPDAAVTSGVEGVLVAGFFTGMVVIGAYHVLETQSTNVVAMAANTLTASALASDAAREVAIDVGVVITTNAVQSVTNAVTATVATMNANTLTASALASDAAREIATDVVAVTPTATIGTASLTLTVGTTGGDVVADRLLGRNIMGGVSTGRTVTETLERIRNRVAVVTTTMSVYQTDDTTVAWTASITTAAGNPIVEIDPGA